MRISRWAAAAVCLGLVWVAGCKSQPADGAAPVDDVAVPGNAVNAPPGKFDFYVFTLAWAPEFCHSHPHDAECSGKHRGLVVHGLWPQNKNGSWPQSCSTQAGLADPGKMLDIMPDLRLVQHEWEKHGTCSGMAADQYFDTVRHLWDDTHVPDMLSGTRPVRADASAIRKAMLDANTDLRPNNVVIQCHNRYLSGVQICYDKKLQPTACKAVPDCSELSIKIPMLGDE